MVTAEALLDPVGEDTLNAIADATLFNRWMYETIKPHTHGKTLEIGSGLGNISFFFLEEKADLTLSDLRPNYCTWLNNHFKANPSFRKAEELNLVHPNFNQEYSHLLGRFDSVFALNVIEHIEDDLLAMKNIHSLLNQNGKVTILVPAFQRLFNSFDKELGHFKRYTKTNLKPVFEDQGLFKVTKSHYFNFVGIFPWYFMGALFRQKQIRKNQMGLYNKFVPVFKLFDKLFSSSYGLSVIGVGKKV